MKKNILVEFFLIGIGITILIMVIISLMLNYEKKLKNYKSICYETELEKTKVVSTVDRGGIYLKDSLYIWSDCEFTEGIGKDGWIDMLYKIPIPYYIVKKSNSDTLYIEYNGECTECILKFFCDE